MREFFPLLLWSISENLMFRVWGDLGCGCKEEASTPSVPVEVADEPVLATICDRIVTCLRKWGY